MSGDVHHAEIAEVQGIKEVTSSGLTHSCDGPWYGFVCPYMLSSFPLHRDPSNFYYTGKNFGVIDVDDGGMSVKIHDGWGGVVAETRVGKGRVEEGFR